MENDTQQPYISDASQPNAGRIYDYFLKGNHNFKIDREMAKKILQVVPDAPEMAQYIRWFIGEAVMRTSKLGFQHYIDFASGLPTVDHIHSIAPEGTKVIYSDIDPITVRYSKKIIGDNPLVKYETCDAAKPEILLNSDIVRNLLGGSRKVVFGMNGICWFLTDEQINHAMKTLYNWADEGSMLFFTDYDSENISPKFQKFIDLYKSMNQFIGIRPKRVFSELIKPWQIEEPGLIQLEEWVDLSPSTTKKIVDSIGSGGPFGGILKK